MAIDLLNIKPHKVSKDLSGYITYIYGAPKTGKTTLATQMDGALLLAFEAGYNALPGVIAQDVLTWGDMKQIFRELKKPEVRAVYKAIIVDTIDVAADKCKKYICQQNGIEDLGDLGYGKGWTKFKDEFNEIFRGLTQLGYAVFFIGHHKEVTVTDPNTGNDRIVVRPSLTNSTREVIAGMADIYGYAHQVHKDQMSVLTLRSSDGSIECGCRFKYIPTQVTTNYQALVTAIHEAIDKEAAELDNKFVTDERIAPPVAKQYDFEGLMTAFKEVVGELMSQNQTNSIKITQIVERYLGKGKKVADATPEQAEFIDLILNDIKEEMLK